MPEQGMLKRPELVLASSSPRRRELLGRVGVEPVVRPADIDETPLTNETPSAMVERLAREKAQAVATGNDVVIGADTTIDLDGVSLAKPDDEDHARAMLRSLSGRSHDVHTGVAVVTGPVVRSAVSTSSVCFRDITDAEIDWYVATGEPMGKAGAYALQGGGDLFTVEITGSWSGIVGLPLAVVDRLLSALGRPLTSWGR